MGDRLPRRRLLATLGTGVTASLAGCAGLVGGARRSVAGGGPIVVAPDGSDWNPGTDDAPIATLDAAMERAGPGDTVELRPGEYRQKLHTVTDGESDAPITVTGPAEAVIRPPAGTSDVVKIEHDHVHLRGTTIDGLLEPARKFETHEAWADRCVFITPVARREEGKEYIRGAVIEPARIGNSARAMIQTFRMRNVSIGGFRVIGPAGMRYDRRVADHDVGHIREIVYVGNAEVARGEPYYEYETLDRSRDVRIHHIDNSAGYRHNELVDVKLGSTNVTVEYCTDRNAGYSTEGGGDAAIDLKGNDCVARWNDVGDCPVPFSFGAWAPSDDVDASDWSRNNAVYDNYVHDFSAAPIRFREAADVGGSSPEAQRVICGNRIERGEPDPMPWVWPHNGPAGVADRRGQDRVVVAIVDGPDGYAFDPPVVLVDRGTEVGWRWPAGGGSHYVVRQGRVRSDPADVPTPEPGEHIQTRTFDMVGLYRMACFRHHDDGLRGAVIVSEPGADDAVATHDCEAAVPTGDGVGHTGGDSPFA